MEQPVCEKVCWVDSPAMKNANEAGRLLRAVLSSLASWRRELPYKGGGGRGGRGGHGGRGGMEGMGLAR